MKSIDDFLPFLSPLIEGMAKHFGDSCEFVVYDHSKNFPTTTVAAIANGHITGQRLGESGAVTGLKILKGQEEESGRYNCVSQTSDGRFLRSSIIYLRGEDGIILGSLCINFDITELILARNFIDGFLKMEPSESQQLLPVEPLFFENVEDLLVAMIADSISHVGVPVAHMSREQKVEGITYLNRRGAFKIKNAASVAAKYYDISRYTLYNYLSEAEA